MRSLVWGIGIAATLGFASPSLAATVTYDPADLTAAQILAAHNRERASVGAPPLAWDWDLAAAAAAYGPSLARMRRLVHSPRDSRPGQRENLAMGWSATTSADQLVAMWSEEKRLFRPGAFPAVSRTGRWLDVAHYTQMIWKSTTRVGCAVHQDGGWSYLICRYSPPGNLDGRMLP